MNYSAKCPKYSQEEEEEEEEEEEDENNNEIQVNTLEVNEETLKEDEVTVEQLLQGIYSDNVGYILGKILSRAGKATGKYKHCYNIKYIFDVSTGWINFNKFIE